MARLALTPLAVVLFAAAAAKATFGATQTQKAAAGRTAYLPKDAKACELAVAKGGAAARRCNQCNARAVLGAARSVIVQVGGCSGQALTQVAEFTPAGLTVAGNLIVNGTSTHYQLETFYGNLASDVVYSTVPATRAVSIPGNDPSSTRIGLDSQAPALYSTVVGNQAQGTDYGATAMGTQASASGGQASAFGIQSSASGDYGLALGAAAASTGDGAVAAGAQSIAAPFAVALGLQANASAGSATALGTQTQATGPEALAVGNQAAATNDFAVAFGPQARASGASTVAMGYQSTAIANFATAVGLQANANEIAATALGVQAQATAGSTTAVGSQATAAGTYAVAIGAGASAPNDSTTAVGPFAKGTGLYAVSLGLNAESTFAAMALGTNSKANNVFGTAVGFGAEATGFSSTTVGAQAKDGGNVAVVLAATSSGLTADTSGFFVTPVRGATSLTGLEALYYKTDSKEIVYDDTVRRRRRRQLLTASDAEGAGVEDVQAAEAARVWELRPVSYRALAEAAEEDAEGLEQAEAADASPTERKAYGFVAEEVAAVDPRLVHRGEDGQVAGVDYEQVVPLLLQQTKALKESHAAQLAAQAAQIKALEETVAALVQQLRGQ